tara:strand:- start:1855 stop:4779 length:2925 start_codon:yes stop_codon:yes gene_type:complete
MKNIARILKHALRKNAEKLIKQEKDFIFEGSWCDRFQQSIKDGTAEELFGYVKPKENLVEHNASFTCNPYQNRAPNDWSTPVGPADACAAAGKAIKCEAINPNYNGSIQNICDPGSGGIIPGYPFNDACHGYPQTRIKLYAPTLNMWQGGNHCHDAWTPVVGDYMLSHGGSGGGWIPWLIIESNNFDDSCSGPRRGHFECGWTAAGCMDSTATNYSPTFQNDCTQEPSYPANCIGGATGANCCCTYAGPGCTDPNADNTSPGATSDDGSCQYGGCTDPTATNYSFPNSNPQVTQNGDPYDGDPSTGNGGTAVDDGSCQVPNPGCLNCPNCSNYDPTATSDDGSCLGCTDNTATNYEPNADVDDGSCTYPVPGCTDPLATNYDPTATVDDGSCQYVNGCTDNAASNFNQNAVADDGSCEYMGCTDPSALNYSFAGSNPPVTANNDPFDPTGNGGVAIDDGSCQYGGCTDPVAINYDPNANVDDGSCVYLSFDCVQGLCEENIDGTGTHASLPDCLASQECDRWECVEEWVPTPIGPADIPKDKAIGEAATNMLKEQGQIGIDPILTVDDLADKFCVEPPGGCPALQAPWGSIPTMWQPYPICKCLAPTVKPPPGSIVNGCYRCDDGRYDPITKTWDPECVFLEEEECEEKCIPKGCTDPTALNYDPNAQVDDGSCEYPSCDNLPLLLANPGLGVLGSNAPYIQDAYDMGQTNGQINGVLDGNSVFCLEVCGGFTGTLNPNLFPCDCCGPKNCEEMGTHPNAIPVDCITCGIPNPAYTGTCHNITNWQTLSTYPPNTIFYNTMADCQANIGNDESCVPPPPSCKNDPTFCSTNPYLTPGGECWICHMMTECMPVYDYLQYGSGPPGSVGTQTFMMNWLTKVGSTFQTPQGSDLYCTEQDCMNATGCSAYSGYSPIAKKADPALDTELPIDDFSKDIAQAIEEPIEEPEKRIQEGVQIRGKLLNKLRMSKLANIKKK